MIEDKKTTGFRFTESRREKYYKKLRAQRRMLAIAWFVSGTFFGTGLFALARFVGWL